MATQNRSVIPLLNRCLQIKSANTSSFSIAEQRGSGDDTEANQSDDSGESSGTRNDTEAVEEEVSSGLKQTHWHTSVGKEKDIEQEHQAKAMDDDKIQKTRMVTS